MPNVKIFVSHRIDMDSVALSNDVYVPVRCGACLDESANSYLIGDDTGINISDKREFLGEFTVQYWAWKNVEADYYGLCHYRRYLSFATKQYLTDEKNQVNEDLLSESSFHKYCLDDAREIGRIVSQYDAVVAEPADISNMYTPRGPQATIYQHFKAYDKYLIDCEDIELFLDTLNTLYPEYGRDARDYFAGKSFRGYNCFVLKKDLFFELCEMEVSILHAISDSKKIDFRRRSSLQSRTYGFFCEWMYGIFIHHLEKAKTAKIKYTQLVFFHETERPKDILPIKEYIPVVFLTCRALLPVTQVAIESLMRNKETETQYDILVLHGELAREEEKQAIRQVQKLGNSSIRFVNFKHLAPETSNGTRWNYAANPQHAAYLLPWMLKNYQKAIVLHSDVLVLTDLNALYQADLGRNYAAAPLDYYRICENRYDKNVEKIRQYKLALEDPYQFFSTSVLIMDLGLARKNILFETCVRYSIGNYYCRDVINTLYKGKIKQLDARWNVCAVANPGIEQLIGFMPKLYMDEYKKGQTNAFVMHYPFYPKPWQNVYNKHAPTFWEIARQTPFYEELIFPSCVSVCTTQVQNGYSQGAAESFPRRISNVVAPKGSMRRNFLKKLFPKGSKQWNFLKQIYYFLIK